MAILDKLNHATEGAAIPISGLRKVPAPVPEDGCRNQVTAYYANGRPSSSIVMCFPPSFFVGSGSPPATVFSVTAPLPIGARRTARSATGFASTAKDCLESQKKPSLSSYFTHTWRILVDNTATLIGSRGFVCPYRGESCNAFWSARV